MLQAEDLNTLFKHYQSTLEDGYFDSSLIWRFKDISVTTDSERKLFSRFVSRICELFDIYSQRRNFRNTDFLNQMMILQEMLTQGPVKLSTQLEKIFSETKKASTNRVEVTPPPTQEVVVPSWYKNSLQNKRLFRFYERKFWKLYEIMLLDRNHIESMLILHQTKDQNVERLFKILSERNQQISTNWCPNIDNYDEFLTNRINLLQQPKEEPDYCQVIKSYDSPLRKRSVSIKISPARKADSRRQSVYINESPLLKPTHLLRPLQEISPVKRSRRGNTVTNFVFVERRSFKL